MALFRRKSHLDTAGLDAPTAATLNRLFATVEKHPQDLKARRTLADALRSHHRNAAAVEQYKALVGAYAAQGLLFRAIAICKTILEIEPAHEETQHTLAALYAKQDANSDVSVEISQTMGAALVVDDRAIVDADELPSDDDAPPDSLPAVASQADLQAMPSVPDEAGDADADDYLDDVIDADTLAALTVRPEGSVVFERPAAVPLFSGLSAESFAELVGALRCWEAEPGAVIVDEGEAGDSLFVIARGAVKVERRGHDSGGESVVVELARLHGGDFFGEIALVASRPRAATVTALRRTELLEIDREALKALTEKDPHVQEAIEGFCTHRLIEGTVRTSPLFDGLDVADVARVLGRFEPWNGTKGDDFICQGKPTPGLFVILTGEVDVVASAEIGHVRLKQLGSGDVCGEMGLLSGQPATASCVAASPVRAMRLSAESFAEIRAELPALAERLKALTDARAAFNARFLPVTESARSVAV